MYRAVEAIVALTGGISLDDRLRDRDIDDHDAARRQGEHADAAQHFGSRPDRRDGLVTHRVTIDTVVVFYEVFGLADDTKALKVMIVVLGFKRGKALRDGHRRSRTRVHRRHIRR